MKASFWLFALVDCVVQTGLAGEHAAKVASQGIDPSRGIIADFEFDPSKKPFPFGCKVVINDRFTTAARFTEEYVADPQFVSELSRMIDDHVRREREMPREVTPFVASREPVSRGSRVASNGV